jgi:glycosyltransferase 2 family protein
LKNFIITSLKIVVSGAIIAWLVWDAAKTKLMWDPATKTMVPVNVFDNLVHQPKHWGMLTAALGFCLLATLLTFVRWWYLVRTLDIPCRFRDGLRISFWGYLFNLAPLGIVGGDLVKAVMLARDHRGMRARAVASVVVDRVVGLYLLFVVASAAILLTGFWRINDEILYKICLATFLTTGIGTLGIAVMFIPGLTDGRGTRALGRIPRIGPTIESLIGAVRTYRRRPGMLLFTSLMSIGVHCSNAVGCYLIACGLPGAVLSLSKHFVIMPLSAVMGVIPLPMGPFEGVLEFLYTRVPSEVVIGKGQGLIVALTFRLMTLIIAAMGLCYYFGNRRELAEVIHEAEEPEPVLEPNEPQPVA